jgi:asparagine synthase (glutamine-hydrolysing)
MPPPIKFQGGRAKHILKRAVRNVLPSSILERKDKMGFPVPLVEWMRGGVVREFARDVLLGRRSLERGIFRRDALEAMLGRHGVGARQLWGALSLELWHRQFIDV